MDILRDQLNATQTYNPMALNSNRGGMMRYLALKKLFNDIEWFSNSGILLHSFEKNDTSINKSI